MATLTTVIVTIKADDLLTQKFVIEYIREALIKYDNLRSGEKYFSNCDRPMIIATPLPEAQWNNLNEVMKYMRNLRDHFSVFKPNDENMFEVADEPDDL